MPIGLRIGPRIGLAPGIRIGSGVSGVDPMAGVARDTASGKYFPATAAQWNTTFTAAGVPVTFAGNIWLFQDAAGNAVDATGALNLTVTGVPNYQQAVTGYTRKKIANPTDGGTIRFTATGTDIATNSNLLFGVYDMNTANAGGTRSLLELGTNATRAALEINNTPVMVGRSVASIATDATDFKNAVRPLMLQVDRTNNLVRGLSDLAIMRPAFDATMAGTLIDVWSVSGGNTSPIVGALYITRLTGAAAEMTDAQKKSVLQRLGWTIPWT